MIDVETRERLKVNTDGDTGPYLMVPLEQLKTVRLILDRSEITFRVSPDAIALDGKPAIAIVNFGRGADINRIQGALDSER
jgi:hypothetical protein